MGEIKDAYVRMKPDGTKWVVCPYCHHKLFPLEENTKIKNLRFKCRGSKCKGVMKIDID